MGKDGSVMLKGSIDMLLCDSTHDYASQQDELEGWFPYLKPDALVWVHDYAMPSYPGVKIAIDEFIAPGRLVEIEQAGLSWGGRFVA